MVHEPNGMGVVAIHRLGHTQESILEQSAYVAQRVLGSTKMSTGVNEWVGEAAETIKLGHVRRR